MAIIFNREITSNLTILIPAGEHSYIKINNGLATCILNAEIDSGGSYVIQTTLDATGYMTQTLITHADIKWEYIQISGVPVASFTANLDSVSFRSPNVIYFHNTSTGTQELKVSLRGNVG